MRLAIALVVLASLMVPAGAAQAPEYVLRITDHAFVPSTLTIPAGQRVQLSVRNERRQPSEFESFELNREKVVAPASTEAARTMRWKACVSTVTSYWPAASAGTL